ncbi:MAG: TonB-dependent receptor [Bacteroidales bacterium]|nr:TonB-dependent receptor [Bacteroidales bacterium]
MAATLFLGLSTALNAQNGHVGGRVTDRETGEPMPFVNVALMRPADTVFMRGATTDFDGRFSIDDADTGRYLLQASFVGYHSYIVPIEATFPIDTIHITLQRGATLEEVQVEAAKPLYLMDGEKNMYNAKEDPSIQTGTASDALQNAPGVEVDAEGNITLRGVSSVEIWINDRPSHMNEEAMKQYIKQLPANAIERIEVITNPSARYSTSGGVINIVTNQTVSRNELLCLGVKAATTPAYGPWLSYVWANEKVDFNVYLGGYAGNHNMASDGTSTLRDTNNEVTRFQHWDNVNKMPYQGGYLGFNTNWKIDSMSNLSAWVGAYPYWDQNSFYNKYDYIEYKPTRVDLGYHDTTLNHGFSHGAYGGAWYEHRYDSTGRKLSVTFNGNYWSNGGYSDETRVYNDASLTDFKRHMTGDMFNCNAQIGANYTLPLKHDYTIEAGAEVGYGYSRNNEIRDSLLPSGEWGNMQYRSYMSNGTAFEPNVYLTAQKRWGGFTAKAGLRYANNFKSGMIEHPGLGDRQSIDTVFSGLIPSIHLSYQTKTFTSYSFSYTRRFSHDGDLSSYLPFRIYDDYSFRTGNPNLLMSYTHNLEAAWSKYLMGFGMVSLNGYWRANTDEIGSMTAATLDPVIGPYMVNYTYPVNIGSSHTEGLEANIMFRPTGFFNVRLNASVFNYGYSYDGLDTNKVSWSARLNVWAKVWNKLELFANARYSSPRLGLYSLSNANKSVDFGVSSDFFNRQLSVNLTVNDIFGWAEWGSNTTAPQYQTTGSQRWNTRFVSFGLTWRIGKMELESKARQGATDNVGTPQM